MSSDYVEVTVKIPRNIYEFAKKLCEFTKTPLEEFWKNELKSSVVSIVDSLSGPYVEEVAKKYKLTESGKENRNDLEAEQGA